MMNHFTNHTLFTASSYKGRGEGSKFSTCIKCSFRATIIVLSSGTTQRQGTSWDYHLIRPMCVSVPAYIARSYEPRYQVLQCTTTRIREKKNQVLFVSSKKKDSRCFPSKHEMFPDTLNYTLPLSTVHFFFFSAADCRVRIVLRNDQL